MTKSTMKTTHSIFLTLLAILLCVGMTSAAFAAGGGNSYVFFDPNGGNGWMGYYYPDGETWTVPDSEFTPPKGCFFTGWGIVPKGPVVYRPGDLAYNDGEMTLYAIWADMNAEQMAELYTPQVYEPYSWNLDAAKDPETGIWYMTAKLGWAQIEDVSDFKIDLRLGAPSGPRVPSLASSFSTTDGSVTTSWSTSYATVEAPFLADGVEQTVTDGAVNGVVDGDVVYATVSSRIGDSLCPGQPVHFVCTGPQTSADNDDAAWFSESGNGTVVREDYSTTITLTKNTVLPAEGLSLGYNSYHIVMNNHTLTGKLTTGGETFFEHQSGSNSLLAVYAQGSQTLTFNNFGVGTSHTGSAAVSFNSAYSQVSYDSSLATVTAENSQEATDAPLTLETVNYWGYANTQEPVTEEQADLPEHLLAEHMPQNLAVTPLEDGLTIEWDADPEATEAEVSVDVVLNDGTTAHLAGAYNQTFVAPGQGPSSYSWNTANGRNIVSMKVTKLDSSAEQTVTDGYVEGFKEGQTLRVSVRNVLGGKKYRYQKTPASTLDVEHKAENIGWTFRNGQAKKWRKNLRVKARIWRAYSGEEGEHYYTGDEQTLDYTVKDEDGTELTKGTDYVEKYENNINAGTATLTVIGVGECTGELTEEFEIQPYRLFNPNSDEHAYTQLDYTETTYNGKDQKPGVLVKNGDQILKEGTDYSLTYANTKDAGTATVNITGKGNFTGEQTEEYTIAPRSMTSENVKATLFGNRFACTGEAITPTVSVKWASTNLTEGTDYTLSYVNNIEAGTASAVLTGKGNYADTREVEYKIYNPVSLAEEAEIDPIAPQIYSGSALEPAVTVRVGGRELTPGWDYSVAYSNNKLAGTGTVTMTGRRDYYGEKSATFTIDPADLAQSDMILSKSEYSYEEAVYTYSGGENKPYATVTVNGRTLNEGTDFTLSYVNNIEAGTATAIATGMGNYGGVQTAEFTVSKCDLDDVDSASVSTTDYNGKAQTPAISMSTSYLDDNRYTKYHYLTEGVDYSVVSWANNVNAGENTAKVTVSGMGNNFTGTRTIDFTINPMTMYQNDYDLSAIATKVGEEGAELCHLTVTWKQNGRKLVQGTDFTVEGLSSSGDWASFYIQWKGNFTSSTGTIDIPISNSIGSLPASGDSGGWNWEIDANGVMTVSGAGTLSEMASWSSYAGLVKKIVVQKSASYGFQPITAISAGTFEDFANCTECTLPDGLLTVSPGAFPRNNRMIVHLPDTVTTIDFGYNSNFEFVKALVNPGSTTEATIRNSENYYAYFGYEGYPDFQLLDTHSEDRGLCLVKYSGNGGIVTIPDFVNSIEAYGFERHGIEKVVIPGSVKWMNAFLQNCYDLRELVIQPGNLLTSLPSQFISGCNNITLYLPDNITSIESPINWHTYYNMLIVANCDSYAIEWAKNNGWKEEDGNYGPRYRQIHKNPTVHPGQAATCETAGWTEYVTCTACNCNTKVDLPAMGHSWSATTYTWNQDHSKVTATRTCRHNTSHVETETVDAMSTITTPSTCLAQGERTYTSAVFTNPIFRVQVWKTAIPTSGHVWTASSSTAAAGSTDGIRGSAVCDVCGEQKAQASVSVQKVMQIPSMMRRIEEEAFMGIAAEQINVPGNTVYIGNNAFAHCDDLLLVVIPASVTTIDGNPFTGSDVAVICPDGCPAATWCDRHGIPHNP